MFVDYRDSLISMWSFTVGEQQGVLVDHEEQPTEELNGVLTPFQ